MTTLQVPTEGLMDTGIVVGAYPADTGWNIEWQRAPDDGGGNPDTGNAEIIATLPPSIPRLVDRLPKDGARRHYRWRHARGACSTESSWSDWVDDIPADLPDPLPSIPPLQLTVVIEKDHQESDFDSDNVVEGRLTLEVVESSRKWDIDFFTRQGRGTSFSAGSSFTDQVEGDTVTQDVELVEKLNSFIRYQVTAAGGNVVVQAGIVSFDPDEIAEVLAFAGYADSAGNVLIAGRADTDTAKVHVTITTDGTEPSDPTAVNADFTIPDDATATDARRWLNEDTGVNASPGDDVRMKARGENSAGVLAPTEHIHPHDFNVPVATEGVVADEILSESIVSGVLTGELELFFFTGADTYTVRFWNDTGPSPILKGTVDATVTGRSAGGLNQAIHNVSLVEKFNSYIRYEIENESSNEIIQVGTVTFDPDRIPEVTVTAITIDPDTGDVEFSYVGDSDVDEIRYTSNVGSAPSDPTTGSSSFVGRANTGVGPIETLGLNEIVFLKVAGYNSATGKIGPIAESEKQREANPKEDQSKTLQVSMADYQDSEPAANNTNGTLLDTGTGALYDNVESDNLEVNGWISLQLAPGVTLTGWNFDYKQESHTNGDDVVAQIYEIHDDGTSATLIDSINPTTNTGTTFANASATLNDTLTLGKSYAIFVIVDSRTANKAAAIARIEIDYDAPRSVEHTL